MSLRVWCWLSLVSYKCSGSFAHCGGCCEKEGALGALFGGGAFSSLLRKSNGKVRIQGKRGDGCGGGWERQVVWVCLLGKVPPGREI